jgi:hypothetical protein
LKANFCSICKSSIKYLSLSLWRLSVCSLNICQKFYCRKFNFDFMRIRISCANFFLVFIKLYYRSEYVY